MQERKEIINNEEKKQKVYFISFFKIILARNSI